MWKLRSVMKPSRIGLISDTHGLLRGEAVCALQGSDLILHAGDVGKPEILEALRELAPVMVVRGNVDTESWAKQLPITELVEAKNATIYLLHDLKQLDLNPRAAGIQIVISGHSHKPEKFEKDGVWYINPGSAGPRRFRLPITVAQLDLQTHPWTFKLISLEEKS